jgi:TolA-binding protein
MDARTAEVPKASQGGELAADAPAESSCVASAETAGRRRPKSVQEAIDHVNEIVGTLRETLDDMDGVLETLELVERQQNADEQEIENLRRALRQLQRPRGGRPPDQSGAGES